MTSKSAMTPSLIGRTARMPLGVRPSIAFASEPTASTRSPRPRDSEATATTLGSEHIEPLVAGVDERVGGAEVDREVVGEEAGKAVEHRGLRVTGPVWRAAPRLIGGTTRKLSGNRGSVSELRADCAGAADQ